MINYDIKILSNLNFCEEKNDQTKIFDLNLKKFGNESFYSPKILKKITQIFIQFQKSLFLIHTNHNPKINIYNLEIFKLINEKGTD